MKNKFSTLLATTLLTIAASVAINAQSSPHQNNASYLPQRVYDSGEKKFTDFEAMMLELARAEVVFVGEQHNDPATHKLERAMLDGLMRRRIPFTVSLEMFERDAQQPLDDYLAGKMTEEAFLKVSRPWPNYATDYRPLVEIARAHNYPVLAANVPRRLASLVSRQGLAALDSLPEADRKMVAVQIQCPFDDYFKRFNDAMTSHPAEDPKAGEKEEEKKDEKKVAEQRAMVEKFYFAQCVKDETMAEAIVAKFNSSTAAQPKPVIVHFNGAFHSDFKLGTAARVIRRLPKAKVKVVSIVPVDNLDTIKADEHRKRGDYVIFCLSTPKAKGPTAK